MIIGTKYPTAVKNYSKSATTLMMCGSASGVLLPPYVIYKSEHLYDAWTTNGPKGKPVCADNCCKNGCRYNRTKSGWIDATTFTDWFLTVFLPHAKHLQGPKVVIGDNLSSHFTATVIAECEKNDIAFVCLVPNSTHLLQPLDVGFFRPFKIAWRKTVATFKEKNPRTATIPKSVFPSLLTNALQSMDEITLNKKVHKDRIATNLIRSFKACGIVPLDKNEVLKRLPSYKPPNVATVEKDLSSSVIEFLKTCKSPAETTNKRTRSKRMNVPPGKSITCADIEPQVIIQNLTFMNNSFMSAY